MVIVVVYFSRRCVLVSGVVFVGERSSLPGRIRTRGSSQARKKDTPFGLAARPDEIAFCCWLRVTVVRSRRVVDDLTLHFVVERGEDEREEVAETAGRPAEAGEKLLKAGRSRTEL